MWHFGFMAWRIGELLELDDQIEWIRDSGFDAIGFHASPGVPGKWRGVDPAFAGTAERQRLKRELSVFDHCEIHAPFGLELTLDVLPSVVDYLSPIIEFAGDVGADILTVHGEPPRDLDDDSEVWRGSFDRLNSLAKDANVVIGVEMMRGFECLSAPRRSNIGVTLDVGHMYFSDGQGYRPYGTIGGLARSIGETLVNLHVHDYDGVHDHIELGTGRVDFDDLLSSLGSLKYEGALCLELNPDRVSAEGIQCSLEWLRRESDKYAY